MRLLNNAKLSDHINNVTLFSNLNMLSVNQLNAQIKSIEVWKALNNSKNIININLPEIKENERISRNKVNGTLPVYGRSNVTQASFINDSKVIWNSAPDSVKSSKSIFSAKKAIKNWVKTLPI